MAPAEAAVVPVASPDEVWDMAAGRGALTWLDSRPTIYRKLDACIELCKQNGDRCASAHARSRMSRPLVTLPNPGDSVQFTHHNRFLAGVVKAVRPPGHVQIEYIINTGHRERASRVWVESRQIKGFRAAIDVAKADVHGTVPCLAWTEGSDVLLRRLGRTTFVFMFGFNDSDFMRAMTAMFTGGRK